MSNWHSFTHCVVLVVYTTRYLVVTNLSHCLIYSVAGPRTVCTLSWKRCSTKYIFLHSIEQADAHPRRENVE